jgi:hypothetical protein
VFEWLCVVPWRPGWLGVKNRCVPFKIRMKVSRRDQIRGGEQGPQLIRFLRPLAGRDPEDVRRRATGAPSPKMDLRTTPLASMTGSGLLRLLLLRVRSLCVEAVMSVYWLSWLASETVRNLAPPITPPGGDDRGRGGLGLDPREDEWLTLRSIGEVCHALRPLPRA